ncbi:hypothetical protein ACWG0P_05525 [Amedibacillus sp. YH-ame6]
MPNALPCLAIIDKQLSICIINSFCSFETPVLSNTTAISSQAKIIQMSITCTDVKEIEYGAKDYDVKKELVKNVENAEIKDFSKLDTSTIGEQNLSFTLVKDDVEKIVEHEVKIIDTKAPIIELEADSKEIYVNDEYDSMSNIKEVKDEVDGVNSLNNDVLEINKNATEEYNKLNKENISDDTKVANTLLKDFLVEDIEGKEEKVLYLKGCYYVDGNVDTSTVGEYKINITTIDKNGTITNKTFDVIVKEKEVVTKNENIKSVTQRSNNNVGNSSTNSKKDFVIAPEGTYVQTDCHYGTQMSQAGAQAWADKWITDPSQKYVIFERTCCCGWSTWDIQIDFPG